MNNPPIPRILVDDDAFNHEFPLPYSLRVQDFHMAMQDVYDFLHDVNNHLVAKSLRRLDDMLRPAILSGILSDMLYRKLGQPFPLADGRTSTSTATRISWSGECMPATP